MIHAGNAITVQMLSDGIAEFRFDLQGESVNKFNRATIEDFQAAIAAVKANADIKGLIVTSGKSTFIVGADITEFGKISLKVNKQLLIGLCLYMTSSTALKI
jgi:3-hydroxyacyl-CoA dehydrogenase/enoyl-CoA hydratase/3-hydroxybutyryl-CoA epimerase/enoyl-CoA isomerase